MTAIPIESVTFDPTIYPRNLDEKGQPFYLPAWKYERALKAGQVFPPITVAEIKGKTLLIDGYNRLKAHKMVGRKTIEAETIACNGMKEAYMEAVKRNTAHGFPLSPQELRIAANKMREMGLSFNQVAEIVHIPVPELKKDLETHIQKTPTGNIIRKSMFANLPGNISQEDQKIFSASSQTNLLLQTIALFENDIVDLDNKEVIKLVDKLARILRKYVAK